LSRVKRWELPSRFKVEKLKYNSYIKGRIGWQNLRSEEFTDEGPFLITGMHFEGGSVDWSACYHVTEERYAIDSDIHVKVGDVLITKDGSIGKLAYVDALPGPACLNSHLLIIRPRANRGYVGRFLYYVLQSPNFSTFIQEEQKGTTFYGISQESIENFPAFFPSEEEQQAIANFLDKETARIDELIAKKERLIELLEQERLTATGALITREDGPSKRLKFCILGIEQGWSPQCENREADPGEWGVLKVSAVNYGRFRPEENKALPATELPLLEYEVHEGDVLMSRANTRALLGAAVCVPPFTGRLLLCDKLYRIIPREDQLIPQYIPLALQTRYSRFQIEREATGASASMQNIGQDTVRNVVINAPTIYRQRVLITAVAEVEARIHSVASRVVKAIDKLREYRTALVSAAVTGQIDVRTYHKEPESVLETA